MEARRQPDVPVLDIGDGIGAVVVRLAIPPVSGELFACRLGERSEQVHTGVAWRRAGGGGWFAVFPHVPAGDYSLLTERGEEFAPFAVFGGRVTELEVNHTGPRSG